MESRLGDPLAGDFDHGGRNIDAPNLVTGVSQESGPDSAAAAQVDDQPRRILALRNDIQNAWRRVSREIAETGVMNEGQVGFIGHGSENDYIFLIRMSSAI